MQNKYTPQRIELAVKWVEQNGLYPQPCGASVKDFCKALDISWDTFKDWNGRPDFSDAINRAREIFAQRTIVEVSNALVKAAKGVDFTKVKEEAKAEKVVEYDPKTGKKVREYVGELKTVKATRETFYYPPDTKAAVFVLTNLQPDKWKQKQETTVQAEGVAINLALPADATAGLQQALKTGAQPRKPKDEQ